MSEGGREGPDAAATSGSAGTSLSGSVPMHGPAQDESLEARLRRRARELGFADLGITTPEDPGHADYLKSWLDDGRHGEMAWLSAPESLARRGDLSATLPGVRSVIVLADSYPAGGGDEGTGGTAGPAGSGIIARYARGRDYHLTLIERLRELGSMLGVDARARRTGATATAEEEVPRAEPSDRAESHQWVAYTDTGPILERDLARRAGLGWFGRNTLLIHPKRGSYFLLGVILTTRELVPDEPFEVDHCGSCSACVDACPTGALLGRNENGAPVIDGRRCISYLTIELRGAIPEEFREGMGTRVFGCDICQEVCPWTVKFGPRQEAHPAYAAKAWPADRDGDATLPKLDGPDLVEFTERVLAMSGKEYQRVFRESPLSRPGRKGMLRNLCVALGNHGGTSVEAAERVRTVLERAAADASEMVREHAGWGLGRLRR